MDGVVALMLFLILLFVVFLLSIVTAVGISLLICGINVKKSNENNTIDYYSRYISQTPIQIIKSRDLR